LAERIEEKLSAKFRSTEERRVDVLLFSGRGALPRTVARAVFCKAAKL